MKKKEAPIEESKVEVPKKQQKDDEPSWYHYLIIIVVMFAAFYLVAFLFNQYQDYKNPDLNQNNVYVYKHKVGDVTYNIELSMTKEELEALPYIIEPTELEILNTINYTFGFYDYGNSSGKVSVASIKLRRFLSTVYHFEFNEDSYRKINESNCSTSNTKSRVIVFEETNETGVFNEENGCIVVKFEDKFQVLPLVDKFIMQVITDDSI